jgi:hypothetical protein
MLISVLASENHEPQVQIQDQPVAEAQSK